MNLKASNASFTYKYLVLNLYKIQNLLGFDYFFTSSHSLILASYLADLEYDGNF